MLTSHLLILAIIQGVTEFLPISSSGHLALFPMLSGNADQGPQIDVAVHVGSLGAVILYFWFDVLRLIKGAHDIVKRQMSTQDAHLLLALIFGTIPLVIGGFIVYKLNLMEYVRSVQVIAWATIIFGIILFLADRFGDSDQDIKSIGIKRALIIGVAQVLALIPGTSRSGITMTAARALGFERTQAARFSMLMSIPAISASGLLIAIDLYQSDNLALQTDAAMAAGFAFLTAYASIALFMRWIARIGMTPFVLYRLVLGFSLLIVLN